MKRGLQAILAGSMVSLLVFPMTMNAHAEDSVQNETNAASVYILCNNQRIMSDQPAVIQDGRTLVPMRAIFEALGAEVNWDEDTQTVEGKKDGKSVSLKISENTMNVDGESKKLDVPAQIIGGRTVVPVRAISEAFDCSVKWNGLKKDVIIIPKDQKAYRIDLIWNGETLASAYYNSAGLLDRITYVTGDFQKREMAAQCFAPLYMNMNGNSYYDIYWEKAFDDHYSKGEIKFFYTDDMLSRVEYGDQKSLNYTYNDDLMLDGYTYSSYQSERIAEKNAQWEPAQTLTYNQAGLLSKVNIQESGGSGRFSYDDSGKMILFKSYGWFKADFQYEDQRLCSVRWQDYGIVEDLQYQYTDEV